MKKHKKHSSNQAPTKSEDGQSDQKPNPGTNWGILHVLKYQHWHNVKKKFPHRKHSGNKHDTENHGDNTTPSQVEDLPPKPPQSDEEASGSKVKAKKKNPGPVLKDSVKYILRAMKEERSKGKEEKSKRKHRRSKTCPEKARSDANDSSDQADAEHGKPTTTADPSPSPAQTDDEETNKKVHDKPVPQVSELKSEDSSDREAIPEDKGKKQLLADETEELTDEQGHVRLTAKLLTEGVFEGQAKEMMDAMDIISMNKEFLSRVLEDPGSPLAQHFQRQQAASCKMALKRSESFPIPAAQDTTRPPGPSRLKSMHSDKHITISSPSESKSSSKATPKKASQNPRAIKRFKDIRKKVKHVVKESNKQEARRIAMDAVMDKIPKDKDVCNDFMRKESSRGLMSGKRDKFSTPFSRNKTMQHFDRSPSLKDSMDKYLQLYESSFQKTPEILVSSKEAGALTMTKYNAKRSLARIFSSPELSGYLQYTNQDSSHLASPNREVDAEKSAAMDPEDDHRDESNRSNLSLSEVSAECTGPTSRTEEEPEPTKDGDEHNLSIVSLSQDDFNAKPSSMHLEAVEEDDYSATMQAELEKAELLSKDLLLQISDLPQVLIVDEKDEGSFKYVKDILQQAGFSGNESPSLERPWHSNVQPLDPSIADQQLQGCMLQDPNCPGNETTGGYCSHLIMFDLINEVLLEIYEGTYSYSTLMMLSSRIRPKPVVDEVWMHISWYLGFRTGKKVQDLDIVVSRDLTKKDGWMNLNFDVECAGLELEELIIDGLLKELVLDLELQPCIAVLNN